MDSSCLPEKKRKQKRGVLYAQSEQKVLDERTFKYLSSCRAEHNGSSKTFFFFPLYSSEKLFFFYFKKSIQLQKQSKLVRLNFVYGLLFLLSIHKRWNPHECVLCMRIKNWIFRYSFNMYRKQLLGTFHEVKRIWGKKPLLCQQRVENQHV